MMKSNEQEVYKLAVEAQNGDIDALSALVERLRLRLFAIAYADLGHYEDAQDAVASALARICSHIGDLRDMTRLHAWVHAIVRNETRRIQRQRISVSSHLSLHDVAELPAPPDLSSLRLDIEQALRRLPVDQAYSLALFYLGSIPIREIALRVGRPEGTIKSWLHHGRRQLAHLLKDYAPMTPIEWTAAIVSDSLESSTLNSLSDALRAAGFTRVNLFLDYNEIVSKGDLRIAGSPESSGGKNDTKMLHMPASLKGTHFIVLDQRIGRHSAFELNLILRAAQKEDNIIMSHCILLDQFDPSDKEATQISVFASWLSGFDLCLTKPVLPEEFERLVRGIRKSMESLEVVA